MVDYRINESFSKKITISKQVLFQEIGDEAVLLDLDGERYFSLDEVGTRVWQLLDEHGELQSVYLTMLQEYDVEEAVLQEDLSELIRQLAQAGLIEVGPSTTDAETD